MKFITCILLLVCGLTLVQNVVNETAISGGTLSCFPEMSKFLQEFGAMKEKQEAMETRLKERENQLLELEQKELVAKEKVEALETRLKESENQLLGLEQKELVAKEKVEALETRLKQSENQLLELKQREASKVIFSATTGGTGTIGPYNTPKTLIYRRVITNLGNAYDQFTGIFVAPVRGIYYFTFFYHASGTSISHLSLMKNSHTVMMSSDHSTPHDGADNGGNAAFLQLQQGDQVYIEMAAHTNVWGEHYHTTFSGFILYHV